MIDTARSRGTKLRAGASLLWRLVALAMLGGVLVACTAQNTSRIDTANAEGFQADYHKRALSLAMNEYALQFASAIEQTADTIIAESDSSTIRRQALIWKMYAIPQARIACFRLSPIAAQFDMWTLAVQMEAYFTSGDGVAVFGDQQHLAVEVSRSLSADIREIALRFAKSEEDLARIEEEEIRAWADANPIRSLEFLRPSSIGRYADLVREQGGALEQLASIEENFAQLLMMLRINLADFPRQARWQAELILDEALGGAEVGDAITSANQIAASAQIGADFSKAVPGLVRSEREALLDGLAEERGLIVRDAERIRVESLEQIAIERAIIVESIETSIAEVLKTVRDERENIVADVDRIVARSIDDAIADGSIEATGISVRVVDMLTIRVVILILIGVVLAPIVARIYARVWPRGG